MTKHARWLATGGITMILATWFLLGAGHSNGADDKELWRPFLPDVEFNRLVQEEVNLIQDGLKKYESETVKEKKDSEMMKVRTSAILIALAAQGTKGGGDPRQLATLRDTALKLADSVDKLNMGEARKQADLIANFKELKADPKADVKPVDLRKSISELVNAMHVFAPTDKGGEGIDKDLLTLGVQKKPLALSDKLVMMAYKAALVAEVAQAHYDTAKDKKKLWLSMSDDMRKYSLDLAETVKAKKAKDAKNVLSRLISACNACHKEFRDN